jgi:tetratricopeptide (TPR) repeat protein
MAIEADSKFVSPYAQLAVIAVVNQKWEEVADYTAQALRLNPHLAPEIYFYSSVANYNLQNMDLAEDHARQAARLDPEHKTPRINHLLGLILADKQKFEEAAENMRIFLKFSANNADVPKVKALLEAIEQRTTP